MNPDFSSSPPPRNKRAFGLTDLLPAAMIKDLRQAMRSPLTLSLILLSLLAIYLLGMPPAQGVDESSAAYCARVFSDWEFFQLGGSTYLCFFVSMHASSVIAADIKERGSNFLRLCPLSAGRIIGGQFLSCALQLVILTLALVPLYWRYMDIAAPHASDLLSCFGFSFPLYTMVFAVLFMQFFFALCSVAVSMVFAHLPLMVRLVIPCCMVSLIACVSDLIGYLGFANHHSFPHLLDERALRTVVEYLQACSLGILLSMAALLLARRHYCAAVEIRSGLLRLICLLIPCLFLLWAWVDKSLRNGEVSISYDAALILLSSAPLILLLDELLPRDILPASAKRPFLLRRCCTSMHLTWMLLCIALGLGCFWALPQLGLIAYSPEQMEHAMLYFAMLSLMFFSSAVIVLALTDLFVSQKSKWRLLAFMIAGLLLVFFDMIPYGDRMNYWPLVNLIELTEYSLITSKDFVIMGGITLLALIVLMSIRAFRRH